MSADGTIWLFHLLEKVSTAEKKKIQYAVPYRFVLARLGLGKNKFQDTRITLVLPATKSRQRRPNQNFFSGPIALIVIEMYKSGAVQAEHSATTKQRPLHAPGASADIAGR